MTGSADTPQDAAPSVNSPAETGDGSPAPASRRRHRRAVDPGNGPEPVWTRHAWEDDPRAWGDDGDASDERILREKPPHW